MVEFPVRSNLLSPFKFHSFFALKRVPHAEAPACGGGSRESMTVQSAARVAQPEPSTERRSLSMLLLAVNLCSLAIFGVIGFSRNETNLLHGLDGSYVLTYAKQQAHWGTTSFGFSNNFFQSLGNVWLPFNTTLIPAYAISSILNGGELDPVIVYSIFSVELFLAAYLIGRWLGFTESVSLISGWVLVLCAMPYFGHSKIYGILGLTPSFATAILCMALILILFHRIGREEVKLSLACIAAIGSLILYIGVSQPIVAVLILPIVCVIGASVLLAASRGGELVQKMFAISMIFVSLIGLGLPQFLHGLFKYTAAVTFKNELLNIRQSWYEISIAFQTQTWGVWGLLLYLFAFAGAVVCVLVEDRVKKAVALGVLTTMGLLLVFGAATVYVDFWRGPLPIYYEILLWPFYSIFAVYFVIEGVRKAARRSPESLRLLVPHAWRHAVYPALIGLPWIILLLSDSHERAMQRLYPYPPMLTPIVEKLREEIGLVSGRAFHGRVATFTGQSLSSGSTWTDLHALDFQLVRSVGNDHRTVGLWYYNIPSLFEYSPFITPAFYLVMRTFLAKPEDHQLRNVMTLRQIEPRILRALGVRYFITDLPVTVDAHLRAHIDGVGSLSLFLYELDNVNLGNFSPTGVVHATSAGEMLLELSKPDFDAAKTVVTEVPLPSGLVPASPGKLLVEPGRLRLSANSEGTSVLILPLEYSHCLDVEMVRDGVAPIMLFRANLLQAGILFSGDLDVVLRYFTGPFHNSGCRLEDARDIERLNFSREVRPLRAAAT